MHRREHSPLQRQSTSRLPVCSLQEWYGIPLFDIRASTLLGLLSTAEDSLTRLVVT